MSKVRKTTIITDPVHRVMDLGSDPRDRKAFRSVIDTRIFQRLRRISQLGLASYVFPGATHTRFSHSLGVYYLAHTVLRHLIEASTEEAEEVSSLALEVKLSALLHDVGHGPFSHSFEHVLESIGEISNPPSHEDWTAVLITSGESEIHTALEANGLSSSRISSVFGDTSREKLPQYLKQIVSSQIDVDRMDYLVRDSHFAGVAVGEFDIEYLIKCLVVITHGNDGARTLGLIPKGIKAYEAFVLARQLMNRTVYYHRKVKVLEYMMEQFIREILLNFDILAELREIGSFIPGYFSALARVIEDTRQQGDHHYDKQAFMTSNFENYSQLTEDSVWTLLSAVAEKEGDLAQAERARVLARMILRREVLPHYIIAPGKEDLIEHQLINAGMKQDKDFSVAKVKTTAYKAEDQDKVFVLDWDGDIDEILSHSEIISLIRDRPEQEALLIVINPNKQAGIESIANEMQAILPTNSPGKRRPKIITH